MLPAAKAPVCVGGKDEQVGQCDRRQERRFGEQSGERLDRGKLAETARRRQS